MITPEEKERCKNAQKLSQTMPLKTALLLCGVPKEVWDKYQSELLADMMPDALKNIFNNK
jgi:hypothetical protein